MRELEFLLDEYSTSGDLDQARKSNIEEKIIEEAKRLELDKELALEPIQSDPEWLSRIDSFVCDLKESQFSDGLHVFGEGECGEFEMNAVLSCLRGKRIDAGPQDPHLEIAVISSLPVEIYLLWTLDQYLLK